MSLRNRATPATVRHSPAPVAKPRDTSRDKISPHFRNTEYLRERHEALTCALTQPCVVLCEYPAELTSTANSRGASRQAAMAKAAGVKAKRELGKRIAQHFEGSTLNGRLPLGPTGVVLFWVVVLTRIAPRPLDSDNLETALKAVRDGIAEGLGIDDRDPLVRYVTSQEQGAPRQHLVRAELFIEPKAVHAVPKERT
jgi:hypothetical protein